MSRPALRALATFAGLLVLFFSLALVTPSVTAEHPLDPRAPRGVEAHPAARFLTMPRKPTGSIEHRGGQWRAGITLAPKLRARIALPTCTTEAQALERCALLAGLAAKLRAAGVAADLSRTMLERVGARDGKALAAELAAVNLVCSDKARRIASPAGATFEEVGVRWTSGELARLYPDQVKVKRTNERDRQRLETYVYPLVRGLPIASFALDDAERIMRALPPERVRTPATRRHVAQLLHRVLALAVFPLRLREANPLPPGFMPKPGPPKAKGWIYPDEDRRLLASPAVPLPWRLFYGFLHREGPRTGEAAALDLVDVDVRRGVVTLDTNKTDDPRAWALSPGVVAALRTWIARREESRGALPPTAPLFVDTDGERLDPSFGADRFREHLRAAGVDRAELFERSKARMHIRLHDTRATFVTLALANGRTETWVADRTGHRSSDMINRYRRAARTAAELGLGELARLDVAIPELRPGGEGEGPDGGPGEVPPGPGEVPPPVAIGRELGSASPGTPGESADRDGLTPLVRPLNPLIGVRIPAPEPGVFDSAGHPWGTSRGTSPAPPRSAILAHLSAALGLALAGDDLEAARGLAPLLALLLAPAGAAPLPAVTRAPSSPSMAPTLDGGRLAAEHHLDASPEGAPVVHLEAERRRRKGGRS